MEGLFGKGKKLRVEKIEKKEENLWKNNKIIKVIDKDEEENENKEEFLDLNKIQIQNIRELENKANTIIIPDNNDNIDFSYISKYLNKKEDLIENDEKWEFKILKNEISSILNRVYGNL